MSNVYIINKSAHDFSAATEYGRIIYLSEGTMNRFACNDIHRQFSERMADSQPNDYIVPCSLIVMNGIAAGIFVHKHGKLNYLIYKNGKYIERNLIF